ncbi:G-protein coupled receptor 15-like [Apostichopus japonicus]|uniref:G-protein coupled receptor 15-like n=1 Tax=Stichopus japonicus TaxID=307972 RepID=UPI003AB16D66
MITTQVINIKRLTRQANAFARNATLTSFDQDGANRQMLETRMKVIRMLLVVITMFIICWTPDEINFFLANLTLLKFEYFETKQYDIFVPLAFMNSWVHPFIYIASNSQFRAALLHLLRRVARNLARPEVPPSVDLVDVTSGSTSVLAKARS